MPTLSDRWDLHRPHEDDDNDTPADFVLLTDRLDLIIDGVYTTGERDALPAADRPPGRKIFNSTTGQVEVRNAAGTAWVDASGGLAMPKAGGTFTGPVVFDGQLLTRAKLDRPTDRAVAQVTQNGGSTWTPDLSAGIAFDVLGGTAGTITVAAPTNVPASGDGWIGFTLEITEPATLHTWTWNAVYKWGDAGAPVFTASKRNTVAFYSKDGGVTWIGMVGGTGF